MLRRGRGRKTRAKAVDVNGARKTSLPLIAGVVLLAALAYLLAIQTPAATGEDVPSPTAAEIAKQERLEDLHAAIDERKKTTRTWARARGARVPSAHTQTNWRGSIEYNEQRLAYWRGLANKQRAATLRWQHRQINAHKAAFRKWTHLRGAHFASAHAKTKWSSGLKYNQWRIKKWRKANIKSRNLYKKWAASHAPCRKNGVPLHICKALHAAAPQAGVPRSWANSWHLAYIMRRESGYSCNAQNPTSTAYGLFQFLNTTWAGTGVRKSSNCTVQAKAGLIYIKRRYGSPAGAYNFWVRNHWY